MAEAQKHASDALERIAGRVRRGEPFPDRYAYGDRPLREEVLREFLGPAKSMRAAITRNGYGAQVLNTAQVAFVDVDLPARGSWSRALRKLFSGAKDDFLERAAEPLRRLQEWIDRYPAWGVRAYQTHSGLRYLVTHAQISPEDDEIKGAMEFLGADPQYRNLCRAQKSFRARLTPKPWRLGLKAPHIKYPPPTPDREDATATWVSEYERRSENYATCRFILATGELQIDQEIGPFVELHDAMTKADSILPLA